MYDSSECDVGGVISDGFRRTIGTAPVPAGVPPTSDDASGMRNGNNIENTHDVD